MMGNSESRSVEALPGSYPEPDTKECERCQNLDIVKFFVTSVSNWRINGNDFRNSDDPVPSAWNLGTYRDIVQEQNCPGCRFLSALAPDPPSNPSAPLYLFTGWALQREEPLLDRSLFSQAVPERCKCLYISQKNQTCDTIRDAASPISGLFENFSMTARKVDEKIDFGRLGNWLHQCDKNHPTSCARAYTPELPRIRLIDVHTRQIVPYPAPQCKYICLSYVWGGVDQGSYTVNSRVEKGPQTIEDAMLVTRKLGVRHLWVDSICIEQSSEEDKTQQLAIMDLIYQGAWATIVALDGTSANAGLRRVHSEPQRDTYKQARYSGFLTLMPSLQEIIRGSPWASRAWTLQEGSLSPRCLYFTPYQVYFECNAIQFCESIDHTGSRHHERPNRNTHTGGFDSKFGYDGSYGRGIYRDPKTFRGNDNTVHQEGAKYYDELICEYTARRMTFEGDALRASAAILTQLRANFYPKGFHWGLPVDFFPHSLMWKTQEQGPRRTAFPSWSWASSTSPLDSAFCRNRISDAGTMRQSAFHAPPLRVWKFEGSTLECIYRSYRDEDAPLRRDLTPGTLIDKDPIITLGLQPLLDPLTFVQDGRQEWDVENHDVYQLPGGSSGGYPAAEDSGYILIDGLLGTLTFEEEAPDGTDSLTILVGATHCLLQCYSVQIAQEVRRRRKKRLRILLLLGMGMHMDFLLLDWDDDTLVDEQAVPKFVAKRLGVATLTAGTTAWGNRSYFAAFRKLVQDLDLRQQMICLG